jgi:DNA-binding MarR family transcriptional regulator
MATKLATGLAERGLVDRIPCEDDRRVVRLELTPAGRRVLDRAHSRRNAWLAKRFAALTDDERVALAEAITVIERVGRTS